MLKRNARAVNKHEKARCVARRPFNDLARRVFYFLRVELARSSRSSLPIGSQIATTSDLSGSRQWRPSRIKRPIPSRLSAPHRSSRERSKHYPAL